MYIATHTAINITSLPYKRPLALPPAYVVVDGVN